jgi:D-ribose pyranase
VKRTGLLNPELLRVLAELGHTDTLAVADAGLPIPRDARRIDLSLVAGVPGFLPVVAALLSELSVEEAVAAEEVAAVNPLVYQGLQSLLSGIPLRLVPHEEFKALLPATKGVVRTGECTPYCNVILSSGVKGVFREPETRR